MEILLDIQSAAVSDTHWVAESVLNWDFQLESQSAVEWLAAELVARSADDSVVQWDPCSVDVSVA